MKHLMQLPFKKLFKGLIMYFKKICAITVKQTIVIGAAAAIISTAITGVNIIVDTHYRSIGISLNNENVDTEKLTEDVENELSALEEKMKSLYTALSDTLDDYNDYNTQKHISLLTGVKCYDNVSAMLYELIAVVITGTLMIMLALALEIIKAYKKEQLSEAESEEDKENEGI